MNGHKTASYTRYVSLLTDRTLLAQALGSHAEDLGEQLTKTHNELMDAQRQQQTFKEAAEQLQVRASCLWCTALCCPALSSLPVLDFCRIRPGVLLSHCMPSMPRSASREAACSRQWGSSLRD